MNTRCALALLSAILSGAPRPRHIPIPMVVLWLFILITIGVDPILAADLRVTFYPAGMSSMRHGSVELLDPKSSGPSVLYVRFPTPDGKFEQLYEPKVARQSFDVGTKTLTQVYDWGTVRYAYKVYSNRIDLEITVVNATQKTIGDIGLFPIKLLLPRVRQNLEYNTTVFEEGAGRITVLSWDFFNGPKLGAYPHLGAFYGKQLIPVQLTLPQPRNAKHPVVDNKAFFNSPGRPIAAGKSDAFRISLVFGSAGSNVADLVPEYNAAYAKARPMSLSWPDRRPMGVVYLANPTTGWKTNPRGYLFGKGADNDITTPAGQAAFAKGLDQYAET
ncbi:MAG TPA: hypothetical protein VK968_09845, partial [Roseimicrobium sp.]|nr:hypothetical protein [Roseimicrobium sp.]